MVNFVVVVAVGKILFPKEIYNGILVVVIYIFVAVVVVVDYNL